MKELTIFAKKRKSDDDKTFYSYLTRMNKKDGESITVSVKFRDECGHPSPSKCPCNIVVDKSNMNMATSKYKREDTGEESISYTLWIEKWEEGKPYVDTSLDEFDI